MDKVEFDAAFDEVVADRARAVGFVSRGKSLFHSNDVHTVALIRLGGRNAWPGHLAQVLCFRHNFLRDRSESVPRRAPSEPLDYPYKLLPAQLHQPGSSAWTYRPHNLDYPYERFDWGSTEADNARAWLESLAALMIDNVVPWALALSPERALREIEQHGENVWCEKLWIEDYEQHLGLQ